jgi:hypothetical protein
MRRRYRRVEQNPDAETIVILGMLAVGGFLVWKYVLPKLGGGSGITGGPGGGGGGGGGGGAPLTEDQAALIVESHRPDLCAYITESSKIDGIPQYDCGNDQRTIELVMHWFYEMGPPEAVQYGSLVNYARAMGWV